eukprot:scaffold3886_cov58-Cyclotella_meneghiniana.AAC.1
MAHLRAGAVESGCNVNCNDGDAGDLTAGGGRIPVGCCVISAGMMIRGVRHGCEAIFEKFEPKTYTKDGSEKPKTYTKDGSENAVTFLSTPCM